MTVFDDVLAKQARRQEEFTELLRHGNLSSIKRFHPADLPDDDTVFEILAARRPRWVGSFVEWLLERGWGGRAYGLIRRLVHVELCAKPTSESYHLALITASGREGMGLRDFLEADPDLLDDEVWRLFEVDGDSQHSLAVVDRWRSFEGSWTATLVELAADGRLSRERLLDASLDALERDFIQFRARWFSRFQDALMPTPEEKATRADRYLDLLACSAASTVSFAFKNVRAVDACQPYAAEALADGLRPVLGVGRRRHRADARAVGDRVARAFAGSRRRSSRRALPPERAGRSRAGHLPLGGRRKTRGLHRFGLLARLVGGLAASRDAC